MPEVSIGLGRARQGRIDPVQLNRAEPGQFPHSRRTADAMGCARFAQRERRSRRLSSGSCRFGAPLSRRPQCAGPALAAIALLLAALPAAAEVLVSNIDQPSLSLARDLNNWGIAQVFTTGANATGYTLASVEVKFASAPNSSLRVRILDVQSNGLPGTKAIATLDNPSTLAAGNLAFTALAGTTLAAGTSYAVAVDSATAGSINITVYQLEDAGGESDWSIANESASGNDFRSTTGNLLQIRVHGTANPPSVGGNPNGGSSGGGGGDRRPEVLAELEARAVAVGAALALDLSVAFRARGGGALEFTATSSDPAVAEVEVEGAALTVRGRADGEAEVAVTATDGEGRSITQRFAVTVTAPEAAWYLPPASDPLLQGFVRVVNRSGRSGEVAVTATDDAGVAYEPLTLAMGAHAVAHFNSEDLENGNPAKGLTGAAGPGTGGWRLGFGSETLDVEALAYLRAPDGFVTGMGAVAPRGEGGALELATFNPASNWRQVSRLRLVNPTGGEAAVTVTGVDDAGESPGSPVLLTLPAGTACEVDAPALESGRGLACGAPQAGLGDGAGKWRLRVESEAPLVAMGLLSSPAGQLSNLSGAAAPDADGAWHVPLFPPASDPEGRQGFVRAISRSGRNGTVRVAAFDDTDFHYEPLTLRLDAREAVQFNADDLELGNRGKRLTGSTGADDRGVRPGGPVEVRLPAGAAVELTAAELESGDSEAIASGALGDGAGKWRLRVASEGDLAVMGLLRSPMGHLSNLSRSRGAFGALPSLPPPPASVVAEHAGGRRVRAEWSEVPGMRYGVELLLGGVPVEDRSLAATTRTDFRWSSLEPGTYSVRVRSVAADRTAGPWGEPSNEVVLD